MSIRLRYPELAPEGYAQLSAFGHYINTATTLPPNLIGLVNLRISFLNGCEFCIEMHSHELHKLNEPQTRIDATKDWQVSDAFTPKECAALRWADVLTQLPGDHASDQDYALVNEFFKDKDLVDLTFAIANINAWNRMGVAFRPQWQPHKVQKANGEQRTAMDPAADKISDASQPAIDDDGGKVAQD